ncbi:MAG: hypothetical protein RL748_2752 [Pseudomonadota bacterium]|jgi:hypothetical protein
MSLDYQRPAALYCYGEQASLQRALDNGEFHLQPGSQCLTLGFASKASPNLFGPSDDACLIIHRPEEFGERLHRAVAQVLPNWAGIDGAVEYGRRSMLGAVFTKDKALAREQEWQFAWRPRHAVSNLQVIVIKMGNLADLAELRSKGSYLS